MDAPNAVFVKHINYGTGLIFAQDSAGTYYFLNESNLKLKHKSGPSQPVIRDICGSSAFLFLAVINCEVLVLDRESFDLVHKFQFAQEINGLSYDIIT